MFRAAASTYHTFARIFTMRVRIVKDSWVATVAVALPSVHARPLKLHFVYVNFVQDAVLGDLCTRS